MQNSYKGWNKIPSSKIKEVHLENALNVTGPVRMVWFWRNLDGLDEFWRNLREENIILDKKINGSNRSLRTREQVLAAMSSMSPDA